MRGEHASERAESAQRGRKPAKARAGGTAEKKVRRQCGGARGRTPEMSWPFVEDARLECMLRRPAQRADEVEPRFGLLCLERLVQLKLVPIVPPKERARTGSVREEGGSEGATQLNSFELS